MNMGLESIPAERYFYPVNECLYSALRLCFSDDETSICFGLILGVEVLDPNPTYSGLVRPMQ